MNKVYILIVLGVIYVFSLGWQRMRISTLESENSTQAQTIIQLELEQVTLHQALMAEKQAVEEQQKITNELKAKAEQSREKVRIILQKEPCAQTAMPDDVINGIKRLYLKDKD